MQVPISGMGTPISPSVVDVTFHFHAHYWWHWWVRDKDSFASFSSVVYQCTLVLLLHRVSSTSASDHWHSNSKSNRTAWYNCKHLLAIWAGNFILELESFHWALLFNWRVQSQIIMMLVDSDWPVLEVSCVSRIAVNVKGLVVAIVLSAMWGTPF